MLPIPGEVKVQAGDMVDADQVVAETFMEGDVTPMNIANRIACSPADVPNLLLKKEGERIEKGEPIAQGKGIFAPKTLSPALAAICGGKKMARTEVLSTF